MSLIETLPPELQHRVGTEKPGIDGVVIAVATDFSLGGTYGEEWLIVTQDRLQIYPGNGRDGASGHPTPRLDLPLKALSSPHLDALVGGGALIATIDSQPVELVRYTDSCQRKFTQINKYLADVAKYHEELAKGEDPPKPGLEEDTEVAKRCPDCKLILPTGTSVCPACMNKTRVMLRLATYLAPYKLQMAIIFAMLLSSTALGLVAPYLTLPLMDVVLVPQGVALPDADRLFWLGIIVLGMLGSQILSRGINIIQGRTASYLTHQLAHSIRVELYRHLQRLSLKFFDKREVGSLMTRVTQDSHELESVLTIGAQFFAANLLTLVGIGIILCWIDWRMFLMVLIPIPVVLYLSKLFWKKIQSVWPRWWHAKSRMFSVLNDTLMGVRVVKAFAQEQREIGRFNPRSNDVAEYGRVAEATWMTVFPVLSLITGLGALIVWYLGGRLVLNGEVTLGTLMTFIAYLGMLYGPLEYINRVTEFMGRSLAAAERVFDILDSPPEVPDLAETVPLPHIEGRIEFKEITFGYDAHKPVLRDIDLEVEAGEMIGLVGHSGAGKSTIANLVCRFYDVNTGQILIDGVDIRHIAQQDLRSQIGVVLQETFLFNGTITENIGYAKPEATREEIMAAAKAANAHDFIAAKADGYDTMVGDRGNGLSGGEKQRIAIARAILHDPRILILDEATSSVDTDTEKQIQDAIARLIKGRTTFAIAHRLSTLRNADRLVVLKEGKIQEMGTHDELLEKEGEFYRLVQLQQEMSKIKVVER